MRYLHLGISPPRINKRPPLICCLPQNDLFHYSFTIKQTRHGLNVGQILFTIHLGRCWSTPATRRCRRSWL